MIKASQGHVTMTKPNYDLANMLEMSPADIDHAVHAIITADLASIYYALTIAYGADEALQIWYNSAKLSIETPLED